MFFKQKFEIKFDGGHIVYVDNLLDYIEENFKYNSGVFYYRMRFDFKAEKYWDYYSHNYDRQRYACIAQNFYLYTEKGVMVSPELFRDEYHKHKDKIWENAYKSRLHRHFKKGHSTTYDRYMHCVPARRAACAVLKEEGEPEFRGARRASSLPDPWDEYGSRRSLSWKDCTKRKRQHKGS